MLGTVAALAVIAMGATLATGEEERGAPKDDVIVVTGAAPTTAELRGKMADSRQPRTAQAQTSTPNGSSPDLEPLRQRLVAAFPTLEGADMACNGTCTLSVRTSSLRDAPYAPSQLPYSGRIEQAVAAQGFTPVGNLMIEEEGGDDFVLRLSFRPTQPR